MATGQKKGQARMANPVKDRGTSKGRTQTLTDRARPARTHRPAPDTVTGQGGSPKGRRAKADVDHPSQRGGVHAELGERESPRGARTGATSGRRAAPSGGLAKGTRKRGEAVKSAGRTRRGRTGSARGRTKDSGSAGRPRVRGHSR